jgi:hypothetical protein
VPELSKSTKGEKYMRILIGQPIHEENLDQLKKELMNNGEIDVVLFPEGYLTNMKAVYAARELAKLYKVTIITSYRKDNKDRAIIINNCGQIVLERAKTPAAEEEKLYEPTVVKVGENAIGYVLCMEILKGVRDLSVVKDMSFIAHPIGVGMFSNEQFDEWINEARKIAVKCKTTIIGTSHADGSYRNCGISIPISYCIDENGRAIYISKADTRTWIVDTCTSEVTVF